MKYQILVLCSLIYFIQFSVAAIYIGHFSTSNCDPASLFQYQRYEDNKCVPSSMTSYLLPKCENSTIMFSTGCKQNCNVTECASTQSLESGKCFKVTGNIWAMPVCNLEEPPVSIGYKFKQFNSSTCDGDPIQINGGYVDKCVPNFLNEQQSLKYTCENDSIMINTYPNTDCSSNSTKTETITKDCGKEVHVQMVSCEKSTPVSSPTPVQSPLKSPGKKPETPTSDASQFALFSLIVVFVQVILVFME
eukprot:gene2910-4753_t